jgi:hypothetical protein
MLLEQYSSTYKYIPFFEKPTPLHKQQSTKSQQPQPSSVIFVVITITIVVDHVQDTDSAGPKGWN